MTCRTPEPSDGSGALVPSEASLHRHPELSLQEVRTAKLAADELAIHGYEVTRGVGGTGVVGVLRNGVGPTVMLRADMDALPVTEATGLAYASSVIARDDAGSEVGVAHACGHDLHVTWLLGAARVLAAHREAWRGTVLAVFQPGEELGRGAQAMMNDHMADRFPKPDVILGQHVMVGAAGTVGYRSGTILSTDPQKYADAEAHGTIDALPSNHSPRFAPVLEPTLTTGLEAMLAAASAWLVAEPAG